MSVGEVLVDSAAMAAVIQGWQSLTEQPAPVVESGSALAGDEKKSPVHQVAHSAWSGFVQAVDHLHAVQALITEARMLHPFAPFALIRAATDNAALAVWLLGPTSRKDRLTRELHLTYEDIQQSEAAHALLGPTAPAPPRPFDVRKGEVITLAKGLGLDPGAVGGKFSYEKVVRGAAELTPDLDPDLAALVWRLCSGFAHGRQWASLSALTREVLNRSPGVRDLRLTTTVDQVMLTTGLPVVLGLRALNLYEQRRRSFYGSA